MSGQTNKRLCGLISLNNTRLQPGMKLVAPSASGKEAGWITSATRSQRLEKEIRARVRETRLQQSCHKFGGTFAGSGWCDSGRGHFASVSLKNFAAFRILHAISTSERDIEIREEIFVLPSGFAFIESSLLSRQRLTLTTLQRLNEAYPEHSFHSLVVRHRTNLPWRTSRLRSAGAEAI
jgi:hypothetical protein